MWPALTRALAAGAASLAASPTGHSAATAAGRWRAVAARAGLIDRSSSATALLVSPAAAAFHFRAAATARRLPAAPLPITATGAYSLGGAAGLASKANKKKRGGGGGGGRDRDEPAAPSTPSTSGGGAAPAETFDLAATTAAMARAVDHLRSELAGLRTGRASPGMLDHLPVPGAYGGADGGDGSSAAAAHAPPLRALAATTARDAHTLIVTPFDPSTLPALETALRDGPLALNPTRSPAGELVVPVPPPTKDAAAGMLKVARAAAEGARAAVRQARRGGMEAAKAAHAGEDDRRAAEKKVQAATDAATAEVDKALAAKEKALAEV